MRDGFLRTAGRVALATVFVAGGRDAALDPGPRVQRAAELGLPDPEVMVRLNGVAMVTAGFCLATGVMPRVAAGVLAGLLVPTTLAGHAYWRELEPDARAAQRVHFLKNVSLFGAALLSASSARRD